MRSALVSTICSLAVAAALGLAGGRAAFGKDAKDGETASSGGPSSSLGQSFHTADKTNIDFSETMIDGKMQAPAGFFLQGRQSQSMSQMVKLRSKWRGELRNSKAAVKALVK
jgi:hypothetical protein